MASICSFLNFPAYAEVHFKAMSGLTHSTTRGYLPFTNNFLYGVGAEFWFFEYLGIEIDSLFVKKGHGKTSSKRYVGSDDGIFTEISLPFLLKFRLPLGSNKLGVYAGIAYSPILDEMDPNFHNHDWNIITGGFFEKWFTKLAVFIDVRVDWGLNYLSIEYIPSRTQFKTSTLYLMGGFKISL